MSRRQAVIDRCCERGDTWCEEQARLTFTYAWAEFGDALAELWWTVCHALWVPQMAEATAEVLEYLRRTVRSWFGPGRPPA